jgi:hypothetical protein
MPSIKQGCLVHWGMNMRTFHLGALLTLTCALAAGLAVAQETVRDLDRPGQHTKFLTHNQMDRWLFEGRKGETIIVQVSSREFDPILRLATGDADAKPLVEVDDDGSQSSLALRLPADGKYEIQIHAFKFQGGGNYTLEVRRFMAEKIAVGQSATGVFDRQGQSHYYFDAAAGQIFVPTLRGGDAWQMLDAKGRALSGWAGTVAVDEAGQCYLVLSGRPGYRYEITLREGTMKALVDNKDWSSELQAGELDVWNITAKPGEFRVIEIEKTGDLVTQLRFAPVDKESATTLSAANQLPALRTYPIASRGRRVRYAAVFGREGRYQLSLLAQGDASYKLVSSNPSTRIETKEQLDGDLPVGSARFYELSATAGELLECRVAAAQFVPTLRMYDPTGVLVAGSEVGVDETQANIQHMAVSSGTYRLHVASLGDGGGGDYKIALDQIELKKLKIGEKVAGELATGETDFWSFDAKQDQIVLLNVRSASFQPVVTLRSPAGVILAADESASPATGSLIAIKIPQAGRHTVWVSAQHGAGEYTLRLIDGE